MKDIFEHLEIILKVKSYFCLDNMKVKLQTLYLFSSGTKRIKDFDLIGIELVDTRIQNLLQMDCICLQATRFPNFIATRQLCEL